MWDQGASGSRQGLTEASPSLQGAFHGDEKCIRLLIPIPLSLSFGLAKYLSFTRQGFIQTSELTSEVGWGEEAVGCKRAWAHSFIHLTREDFYRQKAPGKRLLRPVAMRRPPAGPLDSRTHLLRSCQWDSLTCELHRDLGAQGEVDTTRRSRPRSLAWGLEAEPGSNACLVLKCHSQHRVGTGQDGARQMWSMLGAGGRRWVSEDAKSCQSPQWCASNLQENPHKHK